MLDPAFVECAPVPTVADFLPDIIVRTMENTFQELGLVVEHIDFMCKHQLPFQWLKNWAENPNTSPATQGIKLSEKKLSDNTATSGRSCGVVGWVGEGEGKREKSKMRACSHYTHRPCLVLSCHVLSCCVLSCLPTPLRKQYREHGAGTHPPTSG